MGRASKRACPRPTWVAGEMVPTGSSSQGLDFLPHRSLQAQRGPRGEVRVAGRGPASLQTPQQQSQPEAPISAWVKYTKLPRGKRCHHDPNGVSLPLTTSRRLPVWLVSLWREEGGVQVGATAD